MRIESSTTEKKCENSINCGRNLNWIFAAVDTTRLDIFILTNSASVLKQYYDAFKKFSQGEYINKARIRPKFTE